MSFLNRLTLFGLGIVILMGCSQAEEMASPVSTTIQKTQHFSKYMMSNSASVPVTVRVVVTGDNLKLSKTMPHVLVLSPRGQGEAFTASAKDPRSYYNTPDVEQDFRIGDYRLTRSNMPLVLPWAAGQSFEVATLDKSGTLTFSMPKGSPVTCARQGLVVAVEDGRVMVAHNDGSLSRYQHLESSKLSINKQVRAGDIIGVTGEKDFQFDLVVPNQKLEYRAIPANFTVAGSKTELSAGKKYTR
jgi:Peptidase family M23